MRSRRRNAWAVWSHAFGALGGWYIENSLTTLGQKDPLKRTLDYGIQVLIVIKKLAEKKRKLSYYSNVYIVSTYNILRTKEKFSYLNSVKRFSIRLQKQ